MSICENAVIFNRDDTLIIKNETEYFGIRYWVFIGNIPSPVCFENLDRAIDQLTWDNWLDLTEDEVAYIRYLDGSYTYEDYAQVCDQEECEPLPRKEER